MSSTSFLNKSDAQQVINRFGSPLYVYDEQIIRKRCQELKQAFGGWKNTRFHYAMKANSNLHILKIIQEQGFCVDAVSIYEAELAFLAGFTKEQILFTINNMSDEEMHYAQSKGILLNIDSLSRLEKYGKAYPKSSVCVRMTPEVTAGHHAKVQTGYKESKFGILFEEIAMLLQIAKKYRLHIIGLHEHTGSGIKDMNVTLKSMNGLMSVASQFPELEFMDFGGGFSIPYKPNEKRFDLQSFGKKTTKLFAAFSKKRGKELALVFEPGRYCVAESGMLLCKVTAIKERGKKAIIGVDTGFNHLIRPVMYDSYHHIVNLSTNEKDKKQKKYDIYGNICESGDCFGKERMLSEVKEGDILAILDTGAYGFSMASQYNSRPLPAEVLIKDGKPTFIRKRQTFEDILKNTVKCSSWKILNVKSFMNEVNVKILFKVIVHCSSEQRSHHNLLEHSHLQHCINVVEVQCFPCNSRSLLLVHRDAATLLQDQRQQQLLF
ncbi:diaminopimelate decarboxylase [Candidatus Woesearchaeota archaeon]|nr:diaminopimelate decarboxylase [Candidatus Woesearchaeota archaeon]